MACIHSRIVPGFGVLVAVASCAEPVKLSISVHRPELLVTIMLVRVAGPRGGTTCDVVQALLYAAGLDKDSGVRPPRPAKIINLSLTEAVPGPVDQVLEDALRRVTEAGAVGRVRVGSLGRRSGSAAGQGTTSSRSGGGRGVRNRIDHRVGVRPTR